MIVRQKYFLKVLVNRNSNTSYKKITNKITDYTDACALVRARAITHTHTLKLLMHVNNIENYSRWQYDQEILIKFTLEFAYTFALESYLLGIECGSYIKHFPVKRTRTQVENSTHKSYSNFC